MIGRTPANSYRNLHLRALCVSALSSPTLSVQPLWFQPLTHYTPQRPLLNPFAINPLRTLFISTEGGYPQWRCPHDSDLSNAYPMFPNSFIFNPVRTLLHLFALPKNSTLLFSSDSALFAKKKRGLGGVGISAIRKFLEIQHGQSGQLSPLHDTPVTSHQSRVTKLGLG